MTKRAAFPTPRSLQEWMERHGVNAERLMEMVRQQTGHSISRTMMSFILTGSRRCSNVNAARLSEVTGIPAKTLRQWPKVSDNTKISGKRSKAAA